MRIPDRPAHLAARGWIASRRAGLSPHAAAAALLVAAPAVPTSSAAAQCDAAGQPDWIDRVEAPRPAHPADCVVIEQTPPDFHWPARAPATYELELAHADGSHRTQRTTHNWIAWPEPLPPGDYSWRITVESPGHEPLRSRVRQFTIAADAVPFVIPPASEILERARTTPRPRALPPNRTALYAWLRGGGRAGLGFLLGSVHDQLGAAPPAPPEHTLDRPYYPDIDAACRFALDAAFAWVATREPGYRDEAVRRLRALASWDPRGTTAFAHMDQAASQIAWTLALLFDWLATELDAGETQQILSVLEARGHDIHAAVVEGDRFAAAPYDSHANRDLTLLAAIAVLLVGDVPAADVWLRDAVPLAAHWTTPWGGEDGGFANGTAYAVWDAAGSLLAWQIWHWITGIDVGQKAWTRNFAEYLAYFLPPGAPSGAFGDGAEQPLTESRARVGKALARFAPSPLARWYAGRLYGEDPARLELLLAPASQSTAAAPLPEMPPAKVFPSIGWVAMHSELGNPAATSIYFKSSPYGSFNHSHADQNSFVINAGGERLAIDSGYYDSYRSPHWQSWYKRTIAHNAVTYDGGRGQRVFEETDDWAPGRITGFSHTPRHDIVSGDATAAYGGDLTRAERTLAYIRPDLVVVHDTLASAQPRTWEWNIHALSSIEASTDRAIEIRNGSQRLCVELLEGPAVDFRQTSRFAAPPQGSYADQWHGAFVTQEPSETAEFIVLMRVGCRPVQASVSADRCGWSVALDGFRVPLCREQVRGADESTTLRPPQ